MKKSRSMYFVMAGLLIGSSSLFASDTDDRIEDAFKNSHVYKTQLANTNIRIDADDGVVVLKGNADNADQRRLAEDTANGLPGVTRVDNQITVANEPKEASDDWIALKVRGALLFHRNVSAADTKVMVHNGVVTLTGTAKSDAEKALSEEYAKDIKGVQRVDNQLRVVEASDRAAARAEANADRSTLDRNSLDARTTGDKIDDASITAQLKSALAVRKSTSALRTSVTTRDGVVTITGDAKNGAQKDLVTKIAENIEGVRSVNNNMTVQER
ncbi:MAG TPA: BON domain-containing protein [Opitutaceae bacterium]|nr:BON domain-containing protein [Opitutaceae bacterium]